MARKFLSSAILLFILIDCFSQSVNKTDLGALLKNVNTRYDEHNPILSPDGTMLYFTRANDSLNIGGTRDKGDIWVARLESDGTWGVPVNLGPPVNNDLKNYILGFSPDGNIMFLNNEKKNPGGLVVNDGVAYSVFSGGSWSRPAVVSVDYLLNRSAHQSGSVSADGSTMLLSLQAYASRGEEDIYVSSYQNGRWTQPVNLGSMINTSGQEMTPYLSPDKKQLYFSSNGHGGKGGRDLFVSEKLGEGWTEWSKPKNLGNEVNSVGVELNYFIDTRNAIAYFSSTQNSDGYGDIKAHVIDIDAEVVPVEEVVFTELVQQAKEESRTLTFYGKIKSTKTAAPVVAALNFVFDGVAINSNSEDETGDYKVEIPLKTQEVEVSIKAPGFMGLKESVILAGADMRKDFGLAPLEVGETITLNKVYFERGTSALLEESFPELESVIDMMNENPNVRIELAGHTDNQGNSKLNIQLSQERVDIVKRYLTEHGIDGKRIKGKGYGGTRPVASNASEETRRLNRRVEFTILKN
jgi:OmpA-OmpF porin, OOP family